MGIIENEFLIDSVDAFNTVIHDEENLWQLLVGRVVTRFNESVKYIIQHQDKKEIKEEKYACGKVNAINWSRFSKLLVAIDYGEIFIVTYTKSSFIKEFNNIIPPLSYNQVNQLLKNLGRKKY